MAISVRGLASLLNTYDEAIDVLRRCQSGEAELLGWDAFKVSKNGSYQVFLEYSIDLSTLKMKALDRNRRYQLAFEFMQGCSKEALHFEMVVAGNLNASSGAEQCTN